MTREAIAAEVRAIMARHRMHQSELAERVGLSRSGLSRRLSGHIEFTSTEVAAVAAIFGVSVAVLYGEEVAA